jgi:hypothetical protein
MKQIIVLMAFIGLTNLSHAQEASFECKGITIQNGYITYLKDVFIKKTGGEFELKVGQLFSQLHYGDIKFFERGQSYSYFELFSPSSTRSDHFLGGLTLKNDGSAYLNMIGGKIYNFICTRNESE